MSVLVLGSINMDIVATAAEIPRPGETIGGDTLQYFPGGKGGNQAIAAARAGAEVAMIGALGSDGFGAELRAFLADAGLDLEHVATVDGASGVALIVVAESGENSIVVVPGANGTVSADQVADDVIRSARVAVAQFEVPVAAIEAFFGRARGAGVTTVLNTAPALAPELDHVAACLALADVLVFNETELGRYADAPLDETTTSSVIVEHARRVRRQADQRIVVTLGRRGLVAVEGESVIEVAGRPVTAIDTTGAGDCFVGYLAAGLAAGESLDVVCARANLAASLAVQVPGAAPSMPERARVDRESG